MTGQVTRPEDVVWTQMADFYVATGQLRPSAVTAWDVGGRDEYGFYALGTEAAHGPNWPPPSSSESGFGDLSMAWGFDDPEAAGGGW